MGPMTERVGSPGVGARLKSLREGKRVSLRQIANTTKISVPALDAIERDDPRKLPGGIFGRSFVRAYARELGLDGDETAREFFAQFPDLHERADGLDARASSGDVRERAMALLSVAGILVPIVAIAVWFYSGRAIVEEAPLPAGRIAAAATDVPAPVPARATVDAVPAVGSLPDEPADERPLTLHVSALSSCWVSVVADGREVVSRLFSAGESEAVRAESELRLKVGNATAVSLRLNGSPMRAIGTAGEVVTIRIDSSNASQWLASH
jgi:cytoskeletal protein RodZ